MATFLERNWVGNPKGWEEVDVYVLEDRRAWVNLGLMYCVPMTVPSIINAYELWYRKRK